MAAAGGEVQDSEKTLDIQNVAFFAPDNCTAKVYLAISRAPMNVEESETVVTPPNFSAVDAKSIAEVLSTSPKGLLVVIHGYNNSQKAVERSVFDYLNKDQRDDEQVVIFYRWSSESAFSNIGSTLSAMPSLIYWSFIFSAFFQIYHSTRMIMGLHGLPPWLHIGSSIVLGFICTLIFLRSITYFRDYFRTGLYGAPDLTDMLAAFSEPYEKSRLKISFVAHSMGCALLMQALRSLTASHSAVDHRLSDKILLQNLVMVSPDLTVEGLLNRRTTLASFAGRFKEAFIFSNHGDVVVGMISALANYFSFPHAGKHRGSRLATLTLSDVEIVNPVRAKKSALYGIVPSDHYEHRILVAQQEIEDVISKDHRGDTYRRITYVDCTDYVNEAGSVMTHYWGSIRYIRGRGTWACWLLFQYIVFRLPFLKNWWRDVHSGYFNDRVLRRMIFGAASGGWRNIQSMASGGNPVDFAQRRLAILRPDPQVYQGAQATIAANSRTPAPDLNCSPPAPVAPEDLRTPSDGEGAGDGDASGRNPGINLGPETE